MTLKENLQYSIYKMFYKEQNDKKHSFVNNISLNKVDKEKRK